MLLEKNCSKIIKTFPKNPLNSKNYSVTNVTAFCEIFIPVIMCRCHMKMIYYLGKSFENPSLSISYSTLKNIKIDNVAGSTVALFHSRIFRVKSFAS